MTAPATQTVCKIATQQQWEATQSTGILPPAPIDEKDGFIHLSTPEQVPGTLAAHFAGQSELVVLHIRVRDIEEHLKWETSRGGDLFPHLYAELPLSAVERCEPVQS
ncbi:DUF952 domain-containing protein [Rhodopirellula sp. JC740]|uniref:DUF952 domain-containing protein n=1 Tax=Rhodopirellula halodulae TaxID=2894198 RepID=A0ABS8NLZ7_9BACT|nr:DUF952 domain-containing protein [Rhodopirellula sp. JC740]MCC9644535.1 DUF952 domain-containing protein [Rhodopirellula sp. JC740]